MKPDQPRETGTVAYVIYKQHKRVDIHFVIDIVDKDLYVMGVWAITKIYQSAIFNDKRSLIFVLQASRPYLFPSTDSSVAQSITLLVVFFALNLIGCSSIENYCHESPGNLNSTKCTIYI